MTSAAATLLCVLFWRGAVTSALSPSTVLSLGVPACSLRDLQSPPRRKDAGSAGSGYVVASAVAAPARSTFEQKREELADYLKQRGVADLAEVPKAIILYELTSAGIMLLFWGACFMTQPTNRGLAMTSLFKPAALETAKAKGQKVVGRLGAVRLATSYAEGSPFVIPQPYIASVCLSANIGGVHVMCGLPAYRSRLYTAPAGPDAFCADGWFVTLCVWRRLLLRSALKPVLVPAKLFLTYQFQQAVSALQGRQKVPARQ